MTTRPKAWTEFLEQLDWWISQHGDGSVPQAATSCADGVDYPLGQRVKNLRIRYRAGALSASQIADLASRAGWSWDGYSVRSSKVWSEHLAQLRAHVDERGGLDGLEGINAPLSRWLRQQRNEQLTAMQRRELARIPGALEERKTRHGDFLRALRDWISAEPERDAGDLRYADTHNIGGHRIPLGRRAAYWRERYAAGQLDAAEISALAAVPGWDWTPPTRRAPSPADVPSGPAPATGSPCRDQAAKQLPLNSDPR